MDHLSEEEAQKVREQFQKDYQNFDPDTSLICIIGLRIGDTLLIPPGAIHAPIMVTDCLFRGGMVTQAKELRRSIKAWRLCVENRECTNEDILKQTRSILDWMRVEVRRAPDEHGYTSGFDEFEEDWDVITGEAPRCTCKEECRRKNCACRAKAVRKNMPSRRIEMSKSIWMYGKRGRGVGPGSSRDT